MRTVDPELWFKKIKKSRGIFQSLTFRYTPRGELETSLRRSFADAMKEFWVNSSIRGHKYYQEAHCDLARNMYMLLFVAVISCGVGLVVTNCIAYRGRPPLTISVMPYQQPVHKINFPAIALCSYNLISRSALREYATYLNLRDNNRTYTLQEIEKNLLYFGALYDMTLVPVDVHFKRFLANIGGEDNVTNIVYKLSPRCSSLLVQCSWRSQLVPCTHLFAERVTPHGFCCAFNSRYEQCDVNTPAQKLDLVGSDTGLGVVVRENNDDFAYMRRPNDGIEVLIWDGNEYPLMESGVVRSWYARRNASVFITISARVEYTDSSLQYISENQRSCRSRSWWLLQRRAAAARALCGCVPHAHRALAPHPPRTACSIDHLVCLDKHREMFVSYKDGTSGELLRGESLEALRCARCRPDCTRTLYSAKLHHTDYQHLDKLVNDKFLNEMTSVNTTIIHVFYARKEQELVLVEANSRWYESVASISSEWVFLVGATLISAVELVFHCTVRWRHHYVRRRQLDASNRELWSRLDKTRERRDF